LRIFGLNHSPYNKQAQAFRHVIQGEIKALGIEHNIHEFQALFNRGEYNLTVFDVIKRDPGDTLMNKHQYQH